MERETKLRIILGDNSPHPLKGFGSVKFQQNYGESTLLHHVMYVLGLMKNMVFVSALEDKGMRVSIINGKVLSKPTHSSMTYAFTLGSRFEGLYRFIGRPLLALLIIKIT